MACLRAEAFLFASHYSYKDSNLAKLNAVVQDSKQQDYSKLIDFKAYAPSYDAPASFIAAPIFDRSKFVGVLAFLQQTVRTESVAGALNGKQASRVNS